MKSHRACDLPDKKRISASKALTISFRKNTRPRIPAICILNKTLHAFQPVVESFTAAGCTHSRASTRNSYSPALIKSPSSLRARSSTSRNRTVPKNQLDRARPESP